MSGISRTAVVAVTAGLMVSSLSALPVAHAAPPPTPILGASPDFDADGIPDLVFGQADEAATVTIHYGSGRDQVISRSDVGGASGTQFGSAVLARDLNADSYCDLVIADHGGGGAIVVVFGGPKGLDVTSAHTYPAPSGAATFGTSLALLTAPSPLLVVGGSQAAVRGGSVAIYPLGSDGLPTGAASWINQSSPKIPGTAEAGDEFGAALAAAGSTLIVGVPGEDIGKKRDAGNIVVLTYHGGTSFTGKAIGQNSAKIPGTAGKGDRFGAAVSMTSSLVAVGVPGEAGKAGLVQLFTRHGATLKPSVAITQNSSGVPGISRRGDLFGASVALATVCPNGARGVVVGGPGEAHLGHSQAGTAWVIPVKRTKTCTAKMFSQKDFPKGSAQDYGHFGNAVGVLKAPSPVTNAVVVTGSGREDFSGTRLGVLNAPYQPASAAYTFAAPALNDWTSVALSSLAS